MKINTILKYYQIKIGKQFIFVCVPFINIVKIGNTEKKLN